MKFFTKRLPVILVVLSVAAVVLTGCGNVSNVNGAVTAKIVVEQSVAAMEKMMAQPTTVSQANVIGPRYSVLPNWEVDYEQIRTDLIGSSAMTMYMAEYLAQNDILKEGKTYIDYSPEGANGVKSEFVFCMENMNDGITIKITADQNTNTMLYFYYDYNAMQPTKSIFAQFAENGVLVILFNYKTNEAVEFWLEVDTEMNETFKKSMEEKNMSFDKFSEYDISEYTIAEGNFKTQNIEAYKYSVDMDESKDHYLKESVDEETITKLFNAVYAQVKEYLVEPKKLNTTSAESKKFFEKMMWYAMSRSYALAGRPTPEDMPETMPE